MSAILSDWAAWQRAAGLSDRTITARFYTGRLLTADVDLETVTTGELVSWIGARDVSHDSRATYRRQIQALFGWLQKTGRRPDNPAVDLPPIRVAPGVPRPLTPTEVAATLAAARGRVRVYVTLAAYAGLRVHEIAKIRGEDINGGQLYVLGKGGHRASIPVHPAIAEVAADMPAAGWWFPSGAASGHVHRCSVSAGIKRAMVRGGVLGTPHALRHFYGTQVLRASDLRTAQLALRHRSVQTTAIYTQVPDETLRRAVEGIPLRWLGTTVGGGEDRVG